VFVVAICLALSSVVVVVVVVADCYVYYVALACSIESRRDG
jgi:hypothetical protein